jgi:TDG/mug DNA glycosylase family protein
VLFVGINPGLYSAATGHHFARPGNRFWPALHAAGFTTTLLHASQQAELLKRGYGVTNLVNRATAAADELAPQEFRAGRKRLAAKVRRYRPKAIAFLGVGAYCQAFGIKQAKIGPQRESLEGGAVWVLPNPSGLNANYQLPELVKLFRALRHSLARESNVDQALRSAIANKRLVSFDLDGYSRIGEPHDYGVNQGVPKLFFYQVGGQSRSTPPIGWRWAAISKISGLKILQQRFAGSRPAPSGRHVNWDELIATVSPRS